jgi:hypothetical protein
MLENIVPLSGNTSAGANMVLLGVDSGFHSVPLHRRMCVLVCNITRHIAIAMQKVIVDISQTNVSFNSTSLVSMVPSSNKVSSSSSNRAGRECSYLLFHERLSIDEKMATIRCHCVR